MARTIKRCKQQPNPWKTTGLYIHRAAPGLFEAYSDGNYAGQSKTYSAAAARLFPGVGCGGYSLSYYPLTNDGDLVGDELCADCALAEWLADPTARFIVESDDGDRRYETTAYCDQCSAVISPQLCPHCGEELDARPWFDRANTAPPLPVLIHNYHLMHARCMADLVAKGKATKTGKGAYEVPAYEYRPGGESIGEWFNGTYRTPQAEEERTAQAIAEYHARQNATPEEK